jgi:hypothetical protein
MNCYTVFFDLDKPADEHNPILYTQITFKSPYVALGTPIRDLHKFILYNSGWCGALFLGIL